MHNTEKAVLFWHHIAEWEVGMKIYCHVNEWRNQSGEKADMVLFVKKNVPLMLTKNIA